MRQHHEATYFLKSHFNTFTGFNPILSDTTPFITQGQGRNRREYLDATSAMVGRICPPPGPGRDRVNVTENVGATEVAPVAPVDTSLLVKYQLV